MKMGGSLEAIATCHKNISYSGDTERAKVAYMPSDYYDSWKWGDPQRKKRKKKKRKSGVSIKKNEDNAVLYQRCLQGKMTKQIVQWDSINSSEFRMSTSYLLKQRQMEISF